MAFPSKGDFRRFSFAAIVMIKPSRIEAAVTLPSALWLDGFPSGAHWVFSLQVALPSEERPDESA
jgi:hypothetical protein